MPVLNCPLVDILLASTRTVSVVEAQMPCAASPDVEIGPDAKTVIGPPAPPKKGERATSPMPLPPSVVMPGPVYFTKIGEPNEPVARIPNPLLRKAGSGAAGPSIWIVDATLAVSAPPKASIAIPGLSSSPFGLLT